MSDVSDTQTYQQLLAVMTPAAIRHAAAKGRLHRIRTGFYSKFPPGLVERLTALQLAVPTAVVSHRTAAALHGIGEIGPRLEVTVPAGLGEPSNPALRVHRSRRTVPTCVVDGLTVTTAARTVHDVARSCVPPLGVIVADAALEAGLCRREDLRRELGHLRGLHGVARARQAFELSRLGAQSPMETRVRLLLLEAGFPEPVLQFPVDTDIGPCRLDLAWPHARVCVEYDGWAAHSGVEASGRDRRRWRALAALAWRVHPVSSSDLRDPRDLFAQMRASLGRRG